MKVRKDIASKDTSTAGVDVSLCPTGLTCNLAAPLESAVAIVFRPSCPRCEASSAA